MDISTLEITPQILKLIAEIDEFKGSWQVLGTLTPERLATLRKVATMARGGQPGILFEDSKKNISERSRVWRVCHAIAHDCPGAHVFVRSTDQEASRPILPILRNSKEPLRQECP